VGGQAALSHDPAQPTYASWLNQVEIFFNIFTREVMRGGLWASKKELVEQIMYYIKCLQRGRGPVLLELHGEAAHGVSMSKGLQERHTRSWVSSGYISSAMRMRVAVSVRWP
jgi:hypothetical protein